MREPKSVGGSRAIEHWWRPPEKSGRGVIQAGEDGGRLLIGVNVVNVHEHLAQQRLWLCTCSQHACPPSLARFGVRPRGQMLLLHLFSFRR